jgi:hypothetical protein
LDRLREQSTILFLLEILHRHGALLVSSQPHADGLRLVVTALNRLRSGPVLASAVTDSWAFV